MTQRPKTVVLAHTKHWCAMIKRTFPDAHLQWVLDASSLKAEAERNESLAVIMEIRLNSIERDCLEITALRNHWSQCRMFAVGDPEILPWRQLLNETGFAGIYGSLSAATGLANAVKRHAAVAKLTIQPIEERVWADLPWPTAETRSEP
ncbi:MAG: hypothetical protein ACI87E_003987 [Mariniblastus sp.]|jgi:hypothetical protein